MSISNHLISQLLHCASTYVFFFSFPFFELSPIKNGARRLWYGWSRTWVRLNYLPCGFLCVTTSPLRARHPPSSNDRLISYIAANIPQATANTTWVITDRDKKGVKRHWISTSRDMNPCILHAAIFNHVIKLVENQAIGSRGLNPDCFWVGYFPFQRWH